MSGNEADMTTNDKSYEVLKVMVQILYHFMVVNCTHVYVIMAR